jgi:hypothetical protein
MSAMETPGPAPLRRISVRLRGQVLSRVSRRRASSLRDSLWRAASPVAALAVVSVVSAVLAARLDAPPGQVLWNLDLPKIDYPLAVFFHDALSHGQLPLWNDQLGLGFPLYAEGQIGAFYPPNWLIFQLPPLAALSVSRIFHLTLAGIGAGVAALRVSRSWPGPLLAAVVAVLSGGIVSKLEWTNFVAAYAWLPWIVAVLGPGPGLGRSALAGLVWGFQALAGHPGVWVLTGLSGATLALDPSSWRRTLASLVVFAGLGVAVGAVQLLPTFVLTGLSVRSSGLSPTDLFASAATPFDPLGFGFIDAFVRRSGGSWDLGTTWYPDGPFALLEASAYVGLPVIILAAVGAAGRRGHRLLVLAGLMAIIPVAAALRPPWWLQLPLLNGLRSPVRSYVILDLVLGLLAALGVAATGRAGPRSGPELTNPPSTSVGTLGKEMPDGGAGAAGHHLVQILAFPRGRRLTPGARRGAAALGAFVALYGATWLASQALPATFAGLILDSSSFFSPADAADRRQLALEALSTPWPLLGELALGIGTVVLIVLGVQRLAAARWQRAAAVGIAAAPLILFSPGINPVRPPSDLDFSSSPLVAELQRANPHRVLQLDPPGWYSAMPDQLAAAGVPDISMFSSLNLAATDQLLVDLRGKGASELRRAVGIDVLVTFGLACPGRPLAGIPQAGAQLCRDDGNLHPPYWIPADLVDAAGRAGGTGDSASPLAFLAPRPRDVQADPGRVVGAAGIVAVQTWSSTVDELIVDHSAPGYVVIDRAWWPDWETDVDGTVVTPLRLWGGQLVPVPPGHHTIRQHLVVREALLGGALGIGALGTTAAAAVLGGRRRRPRPQPR